MQNPCMMLQKSNGCSRSVFSSRNLSSVVYFQHHSRFSSTTATTRPASSQQQQQRNTSITMYSSSCSAEFNLACPICQKHRFVTNTGSHVDLSCPRCNRTFSSSSIAIDLTLTSGIEQKSYNQTRWGGVEIFRNPLVSLAYERGWRSSFVWAGFPGVDQEFDIAMNFLRPAYGNVILDASCGTGLFSRRFLSSGKFSGVIAMDFSESMLKEAKRYFDQDPTVLSSKSNQQHSDYLLLRADIGRLPFETASLAAVHAGAALHCWPDPQAALAEIARVLRPGGVFVASTFLVAGAPLGQILGDDSLVRPLRGFLEPTMNGTAPYKWWEEQELRDLCAAVGLQGFQRDRRNRFILLCVTKPACI